MNVHQARTARELVAGTVARTVRETDLLVDPEFKHRMLLSIEEIMMNPDYPKEFVAAVAATAIMMLVEKELS